MHNFRGTTSTEIFSGARKFLSLRVIMKRGFYDVWVDSVGEWDAEGNILV